MNLSRSYLTDSPSKQIITRRFNMGTWYISIPQPGNESFFEINAIILGLRIWCDCVEFSGFDFLVLSFVCQVFSVELSCVEFSCVEFSSNRTSFGTVVHRQLRVLDHVPHFLTKSHSNTIISTSIAMVFLSNEIFNVDMILSFLYLVDWKFEVAQIISCGEILR